MIITMVLYYHLSSNITSSPIICFVRSPSPGIDRTIETLPLVLLSSFLFLLPFTPPHLFLPSRPRIRI